MHNTTSQYGDDSKASSQLGYRTSWHIQRHILACFNVILEGKDVGVVARTGAGKALFFALIGLVATISETDKLVIVISPLKALQDGQVRAKPICYESMPMID